MSSRRRALMAQSTDGWTSLSITWTVHKNINSSGEIVDQLINAMSQYILVSGSTEIRRDMPVDDLQGRTDISMWFHEYSGETWLRRTILPKDGTPVQIGSSTTQFRLTIAYPSSNQKTMSQANANYCGNASIK